MADLISPVPQPALECHEVELYGTKSCPYTSDLREDLAWRRIAFTEYDVDADAAARARLLALTGGRAVVPVLVENGRVKAIGWRGRGCTV
jgi:glutaredoxin 3